MGKNSDRIADNADNFVDAARGTARLAGQAVRGTAKTAFRVAVDPTIVIDRGFGLAESAMDSFLGGPSGRSAAHDFRTLDRLMRELEEEYRREGVAKRRLGQGRPLLRRAQRQTEIFPRAGETSPRRRREDRSRLRANGPRQGLYENSENDRKGPRKAKPGGSAGGTALVQAK